MSLDGNEAVQSTKEMAINSVYNPLNQLTNAYTVRDRPTLKAVERFRNGSVRELIARVTHFTSGFIERVTHFTSGFIVKLIVKLIVNLSKNYTLSNELYSNYAKFLSIHGGLTDESLDDVPVNQRNEESVVCLQTML